MMNCASHSQFINLQHGPLQGEGVTELLSTGPRYHLMHHVGRLISTSKESPLSGCHVAAVAPCLHITSWKQRFMGVIYFTFVYAFNTSTKFTHLIHVVPTCLYSRQTVYAYFNRVLSSFKWGMFLCILPASMRDRTHSTRPCIAAFIKAVKP